MVEEVLFKMAGGQRHWRRKDRESVSEAPTLVGAFVYHFKIVESA